jgi:hypothetical protein
MFQLSGVTSVYGPPGADHVYGFVYIRQLPKDVLGFCI